MIWEAVIGEELPCKAQDLHYMDHFTTFGLLNFLRIFQNQSAKFHPLVTIHLLQVFIDCIMQNLYPKHFGHFLNFYS